MSQKVCPRSLPCEPHKAVLTDVLRVYCLVIYILLQVSLESSFGGIFPRWRAAMLGVWMARKEVFESGVDHLVPV